ncbi:MAG TPA: hypothetical protein PLK35_03955, partial [Candidatus Moranbacteria bacterium]|nr:hypothetical protein [Candidatus Moranbacteria bacterium]
MKVLGKYKKIIVFSATFVVGAFFLSIFFLDSKKVEISNISGKEKEVTEGKIENGESIKKEENLEEKINQANGKEAEENEGNKASEAGDKNEDSNSSSITNKLVSWGYEKAEGRKIDAIVVHSS